MKFPNYPRSGRSLRDDFRDLINFARASRITSVIGGKIKETPNGSVLVVDPPKITRPNQLLPFEVFSDASNIYAAAGSINGIAHAQEVEEDPADGDWSFRVKAVINTTTGEITSTDVLWESSETANTTTDFYNTIATITVTDGVPEKSSISQINYGPMFAIAYGAVTEKWEVGFI